VLLAAWAVLVKVFNAVDIVEGLEPEVVEGLRPEVAEGPGCYGTSEIYYFNS